MVVVETLSTPGISNFIKLKLPFITISSSLRFVTLIFCMQVKYAKYGMVQHVYGNNFARINFS